MADTKESDVQKRLLAHAVYARTHSPTFSLNDLDTFLLFDQNKIRATPPTLDILKWGLDDVPRPTEEDLATITEEEIHDEMVNQQNTMHTIKKSPMALTRAKMDALYTCPVGTTVLNLDTLSFWAFAPTKKWTEISC